jgi:hypothetical protein
MTCLHCGWELAPGEKFCSGCGAPVMPAPAKEPPAQGGGWILKAVAGLAILAGAAYLAYHWNLVPGLGREPGALAVQRTAGALTERPLTGSPPPEMPVAARVPPAAEPRAGNSAEMHPGAPAEPRAGNTAAIHAGAPAEGEAAMRQKMMVAVANGFPGPSGGVSGPTVVVTPMRETPARERAAETNRGPTSGLLVWSGRLEKNETLAIEGGRASTGSVAGALPGAPVLLDLDLREFEILEMPSPANEWKKLVFRGTGRGHTAISIRWSLAP